ncbi:hypothetical protein RN001_003008 [Aquatica leii]|uniref:Protein stoned-B n=1 Tax=Aquatica leii TaxID=1421715 RepID=A0AAN7PHN7_9COLE|nr:hypothetical protein RN001_003008 [Aquatica leii]
MHKITKGLKKKKKGKKSKHKEEELFKPEELEAYRREHQQTVEEAAPATANDEWKKFNALTAGIDSFLKKTQNDLDRIKSTSFFQRVPPPSEVKNERDLKSQKQQSQIVDTPEDVQCSQNTNETGIIVVSESETEDEDEDDIFDTTYIDAIAAGDVKLAYIPGNNMVKLNTKKFYILNKILESPTEQAEGDDPFDTSIAERAILGPAVAKKGKKLVPLGSAVEVLTGRVQAPSCVPINRPSTRRAILKEKDLLLDSFDDNANSVNDIKCNTVPISKPSLLDDDSSLPLIDEPIDLSKSLHPICTPLVESLPYDESNANTSVLKEFDIIGNIESVVEDEDDIEFALLAAESLTKTSAVTLLPTNVAEPVKNSWKAFEEPKTNTKEETIVSENLENDPFDTTFAENVVPGKFELKIIENEILSNENDLEFNPRVEEKFEKLNELLKSKVSIQVTNPAGLQDSLERISASELNTIQPEHRDLLGGSITDLSSLGDQPLQPKQQVDEDYIEYCDPFDTSLIESATIPGHTELKLLEKELLSDTNNSDDEFDPRANEIGNRKASSASVKVTFTLPLPDLDDDVINYSDNKKSSKPLTPYYARENSVLNETFLNEDEIEDEDPFDTSFVKNITPGKAELKVIEKELFQVNNSFSTITDTDFNPRDEKQVAVAKVVQTINKISDKPNVLPLNDPDKIDLLAVDNEISAKVLTPATDKCIRFEELSYADPFDTSIACNILPGKAELKLLETELVHTNLQRVLSDPDFNPRDSTNVNETFTAEKDVKPSIPDLLEHTIENVSTKILTPIEASATYAVQDVDIDPFDTSIANNIDDYSAGNGANSNPFLMDDDDFFGDSAISDNPFISQSAATISSNSTNPFAFDPMELGPAEAELAADVPNTFQTCIDSNTINLIEPNKPQELLSDANSVVPITAPQKPSGLNLKHTNTVESSTFDQNQSLHNNVQIPNGPPRPPPPRPPPSKETQDLLISHLLDKIPPTRTPSPVSMRDLHSPSPTPEPIFSDLLDVNHSTAPPKPPPPSTQPLLFSDSKIQEAVTKVDTSKEFDLFGLEDVKEPQKSTADIMNLYNTSSMVQSQPKPDLLFDSIENNVKPITTIEELTTTSTNTTLETTIDTSVPNVQVPVDSLVNTPIIQDNFISPEPSQSDLQMDTSDSQSKGSISSVTFNPFSANEDNASSPVKPINTVPPDIFASTLIDTNDVSQNSFAFTEPKPMNDEFDAFAIKFESAAKDENKNGVFDAFSGNNTNTWGNNEGLNDSSSGFDNEEPFDTFLSMQEPPVVPQSTPSKLSKAASQDSDEDKDFSVFIRPKSENVFVDEAMPVLAPPPSAPIHTAFTDTSPRFNPFDQQLVVSGVTEDLGATIGKHIPRSDSQETPPTPLFDEDMSQPLQPFPRVSYDEEGWEMQFWKKIFIRLLYQTDCVLLQLFNQKGDKDPFQELPLQPCYSVSEIGAQQYDNYGKIFTLKLQYIFYKERPGVRPGQVKKAERITNKLSQFASYAIQGDYQGVKEFGSDLKKLGLPVEHAPQVSQLMKLGSLNYEDLKQFSVSIEEALFKLQAHRDRALHYKMEEVQITAVDELYVDQDSEGHIERQIARVRLFFLGFLTGMPDIELGVNDMRRQGKEVVGRHDIIPVITEEWIRLEDVEFHSCIQQDDYQNSHIIKFKPPDACYIELMRFRVRPPKNRELPLQLKTTFNVTGNKVVIKADVLVPGFASRKLGQVPCEDVMIRIPIPECWIYLFRVEKHFRYGSVKSTHRRTGKIKGIERILGTMETLQESLIEVTSGHAKYEHQHKAIVWRCPRLPKEGQGAYTTHNLVSRLALTSYDQIPDQLAEYCYVEFTMPATQVSHTTVRSVSLQNSDSDEPPEKYVRYLARHEYRVGIEHTEGENVAAYSVATVAKPTPPVPEQQPSTIVENESSEDSD